VTHFRIATWNVNSVRLRTPLLARWVELLRPDVVCLQETKVVDDLFPREAIADLGFEHIAIQGQKSYNGVAILSRHPLSEIRSFDRVGRKDCRHIAARVRGIDIHSLYIPAGGDIPDPDSNDKFAHKLDFLRELTAWGASSVDPADKVVLTGDFNIAPLETDVWSHKALLKVISHTPIEVEMLAEMQAAVPWVDAVRKIITPEKRLYSWWSYRSPDWTANDRGRRLDHLWVTPALADSVLHADALREVRSWDQPSDHVPVLIDLDERVLA